MTALRLIISLVCIFKAGPFSWDSRKQRVSLLICPFSKFVVWGIAAFIFLHFGYASFRSVQSILFLGGSATSFLLQLTMVGQAGLSFVCNLNTILRPTQMAEFLNQYLYLQADHTIAGKIGIFTAINIANYININN